MPANQIYNNLDRGVIDASMIPMSAALDFKLIEVTKYFTINAPLGRSPFLVAMNRARYEKLPADLKKVIDDTTGLKLSLKGAETYDKKNDEAIAAAKKTREMIALTPQERQRWVAAFKPMIQQQVAAGEKAGLPARGLVSGLRPAELMRQVVTGGARGLDLEEATGAEEAPQGAFGSLPAPARARGRLGHRRR